MSPPLPAAMPRLLFVLLGAATVLACDEAADGPDPRDAGDAGDVVDAGDVIDAGGGDAGPPVELTPNLCDDAGHLTAILRSFGTGGEGPSYGEINMEQLQRMLAAPTEGPFYMVNLLRYRELAEYPDGRETDLTGREADALYAPIEFLTAIGARVVFVASVGGSTLGEPETWDDVAIVEYPCPLALLAMSAHPEFQARAVHKEAGLEASIVMVTHLQALEGTPPAETPHPATEDDPAFDMVQVIRHREQAQYEAGSGEPPRTGREAMALYASSVLDAERRLGVYPRARLAVEGVFIGDGRAWDEVWIDVVPSGAAFDVFVADAAVLDAERHREAALEDGYGLVTSPLIAAFPTAP